MPTPERPSIPPTSTSDRQFSLTYRKLALECFVKAVTADHPDGADTLRRMGRHYTTHADARERSLSPTGPHY